MYRKRGSTLTQRKLCTREKRKTDSSELHDKSVPYDTGETDLSEYFVKTKTDGPYASLLSDVTFKKAFSPDTETGKANLINLLNKSNDC